LTKVKELCEYAVGLKCFFEILVNSILEVVEQILEISQFDSFELDGSCTDQHVEKDKSCH